MFKSYILLLITVSFFSFLPACNLSNDEGNENNENEAIPPDRGNEITNFDELDKKMRQLMNEKSEEDLTYKDIELVSLNGADEVEVDLKIGAGKLRLSGGSSELLLAGFLYTDRELKPVLNYKVKGHIGKLRIDQPETNSITFNNDDNSYLWNLKFNNQVPLDFNIELGAGISEIYLSELNIEDFSITMGVGKTEIDLRGNWEKSTSIHVIGGIGLLKVYLPDNAGVLLQIDKAIGSLDIKGLSQKSRSEYVNKQYETADVLLSINIKTGIGEIQIE